MSGALVIYELSAPKWDGRFMTYLDTFPGEKAPANTNVGLRIKWSIVRQSLSQSEVPDRFFTLVLVYQSLEAYCLKKGASDYWEEMPFPSSLSPALTL